MGAKVNKLLVWLSLSLAISGFALRYQGVGVDEWSLVGIGVTAACVVYLLMTSRYAKAIVPIVAYGVVEMSLPMPIRHFAYEIPVISDWSRTFFSIESNPWQYGVAAFVISICINELICKDKWKRSLFAFTLFLLWIVYQYMFDMHLLLPMGYLLVYLVTSQSIHIEKQRAEGLWAFIVAVAVLLTVIGIDHFLPYNKVNGWVMDRIPDKWKISSGTVRVGGEKEGVRTWHSLYYPRGNKLGGSVDDRSGATLFKIQTTEQPLYLRCAVYTEYDGHGWHMDPGMTEKVVAIRAADNIDKNGTRHFYYEGPTFETWVPFGPLGAGPMDSKGRVEYSGRDMSEPVDNDSDHDNANSVEKKVELPERVKLFAKKILKNTQSDMEKIRLLEDAVSTHGEYALDVTTPPDDMDFIDYFLFEEQKGYCTYYATTLAVLLREGGILSRYVEGFLVDPLKTERGKFIVTEEESHAWVEAYVDGQGWITLDPTPARSAVGLSNQTVVGSGGTLEEENMEPVQDKIMDNRSAVGQMRSDTKAVAVGSIVLVILLGALGVAWRISGRMLFESADRKSYKRTIGYFDYLFVKAFKDRPTSESIGRRATLWVNQDVSGSVTEFDAIMEDVDTVLYARELDSPDVADRVIRFIRYVETKEGSWFRRLVGRMIFLKGWHYGRNNR